MATTTAACSANLYHIQALRTSPLSKSHFFSKNLNFTSRTRTIAPKSTPQRNTDTSSVKPTESPEPKPAKRVEPVPENSSIFSIVSRRLRIGNVFDELGLEILAIALPAVLALAADPITSLVDTAFVGHIGTGSVELAAVGVSVSVFNLVSKLFNVPLLNITTSFVAEEQASVEGNEGSSCISDGAPQRKRILPSVSTSLALAAGIGIAETIALSFGSGFILNIMGIAVDSPMRLPAEHFLTVRAFGAPAVVIALAAQGTFRGFKDTKTPLIAIAAGNILNAILDPIFIFISGLGIGGAAVATVISEYLIALLLLWELNGQVQVISPNFDMTKIPRYLKSGVLLIARTLAVVLTMTLATSMAAREGPIHMAGYQISVQVWLAVSLMNDALALSGQALLASGFSQKNYGQSQQVVYRVLEIGLVSGIALAAVLFPTFQAFSHLFSVDPEVLKIACSGTLFVAGSQPINAIAFVFDGLYYGVSDFGYAAYSTVVVGLVSSIFIVVAAPIFGIAGVWAGLFLFMSLRVIAGIWRLGRRSGPWQLLWSEIESGDE